MCANLRCKRIARTKSLQTYAHYNRSIKKSCLTKSIRSYDALLEIRPYGPSRCCLTQYGTLNRIPIHTMPQVACILKKKHFFTLCYAQGSKPRIAFAWRLGHVIRYILFGNLQWMKERHPLVNVARIDFNASSAKQRERARESGRQIDKQMRQRADPTINYFILSG